MVRAVAGYTPFEIKWRVPLAEISYLVARHRQSQGEHVEKMTKVDLTMKRLEELMEQRLKEYEEAKA